MNKKTRTTLRDLTGSAALAELPERDLRMVVGGAKESTGTVDEADAWTTPSGPNDVFRIEKVLVVRGK